MIQCEEQVLNNPNLNLWFDPISVFPSLTATEICFSHWEAFTEIRSTTDTSQETKKYLEASYFTSLSLNLAAEMNYDYNNCVNLEAVEGPNEWASEFLLKHRSF